MLVCGVDAMNISNPTRRAPDARSCNRSAALNGKYATSWDTVQGRSQPPSFAATLDVLSICVHDRGQFTTCPSGEIAGVNMTGREVSVGVFVLATWGALLALSFDYNTGINSGARSSLEAKGPKFFEVEEKIDEAI